MTIAELTAHIDVPDEVRNFAHIPGGEVVFGPGALAQVGEKAKAVGKRALLVTDPGLRAAGHEARTVGFLREAGLEVFVFDETRENPTTKDVARGVEVARGHQIDLIIGLGGGSSLDTAKGVNFILTNGGEMKDYWGVGKATQPMLPFIAIPTTSGTGSECQSFALIADEATHMKMACGDKKAAAVVSILDPELTLTKPRLVTAVTGIDAIGHAVETAVCNKRSETSLAYSRIAFRMLDEGFQLVCDSPEDLEARARMQLGAAYAGTAIENSMLGAAHSCANPLTANFGVIHGQAVGIMLPHVIRWNRRDSEAAKIYDRLASNLDSRIEQLLSGAGMKSKLSDCDVTAESIPKMAAEAAEQWTANFNPVPLTASDFEELYRSAL
ncbi:MAG: alcohol dehydrogenase [Verrucomicrobiales bacterium]|jgi:alcohol dehydrogenase